MTRWYLHKQLWQMLLPPAAFSLGENNAHRVTWERNQIKNFQSTLNSSKDYLNLHVRVLWTHLELRHSLFAELGDIHRSWGAHMNNVLTGMRGHHLLMVLPS